MKDHRKSVEKLPTISLESTEIEALKLQPACIKIISRLMKIWENYRDTKENRVRLFNLGHKLHSMIIETMKLDPDLRELAELQDMLENIKQEYEQAIKDGIIKPRSEAPVRDRIIADFIETLPCQLKDPLIEYAKHLVKPQAEESKEVPV